MKEREVLVDQSEGRRKYQNLIHRDGKWYARVTYKSNGEIDPGSYNMKYRDSLKAAETPSVNSSKKVKSGKKRGYFGMSRWNPLNWILVIIMIPFKIVWFILKFLGLGFFLNLFFGDSKK